MATLTRNLFRGQGESEHRLEVVEGHWPTDVDGWVFVVGPDKRQPGGHWLAEHGLLQKIHLRPDGRGRVHVQHRRVATRIERIRRRAPWLFRTVQFMEVSPFGVSNLANTNVQAIDGRLFVGYDAGRPIEVDPVTMEAITPVGGNDEWLQGAPGLLEPLCAVAAHPAPDLDEHALWFVSYTQIAPPDEAAETHIARWALDGPVQRWRVVGMSPFDSIHDIKVSRDHIVFADLPFVFEPGSLGPNRTRRNQEHTTLWIVAKADLRAAPPGTEVRATEVRIPVPTGHIWVDHDEPEGRLRIVAQHVPLGDLLISITPESRQRSGAGFDSEHEGLIAIGVQPSLVGRYLVDPRTGTVEEAETACDADRVWGGILATTDVTRAAARDHLRQLWYAGVGYDPELLPAEWWRLYGDATDGVVAPADMPRDPRPGTLCRIDVDAMKVAEVHAYADGAFPTPPTFIPRRGATDPDDGYVLVVVHQDGAKELQVFDASHIEAGPLARATSSDFNPCLMLHSCWMPERVGPRPSAYRIGLGRDLVGAVAGLPGVLVRFGRVARAMRGQVRRGRRVSPR